MNVALAQNKPPMLRGDKWRSSHQASVDAVLTAKVRRVVSKGGMFANRDRWPARFLIKEMCDFAKANPGRKPTFNEFCVMVRKANAEIVNDPHIIIANTPDEMPLSVALALVGGGYHEAFHTKYSQRRDINPNHAWGIVEPRWDSVPDWSGLASMLLTWSNIIEDIRIERRGCEDFPGAHHAMCDLQNFILDQEAEGRAKAIAQIRQTLQLAIWSQAIIDSGRNPRQVAASMDPEALKAILETVPVPATMINPIIEEKLNTTLSVVSGVFRDIGLGYNTERQRKALAQYREQNNDAVRFVMEGPLEGLLRESIKLNRRDGLGSLRIAMDVMVHIYEEAQKEQKEQEDSKGQGGEQKCPACDSPNLKVRPLSDGKGGTVPGKGVLICKDCGHEEEIDLEESQGGQGGESSNVEYEDIPHEPGDDSDDNSEGDDSQDGDSGDDSDEDGDQSGSGSSSDSDEDEDGEGSDSSSGGSKSDEDGDEEEGSGSGSDEDGDEDGEGDSDGDEGDSDGDEGDSDGDEGDSDEDGSESKGGDSDEDGSESKGGKSDEDGDEGDSDEDGESNDSEGDTQDGDDPADGDEGDSNGAGGHSGGNKEPVEPWKALAEEFLAGAEEGDDTGLLDSSEALGEAFDAEKDKEDESCQAGEAPYRPYDKSLDSMDFVQPSRQGMTADRTRADAILSAVRQGCSYLRARLMSLVRAVEQRGTSHGVLRGRRLSPRMLVNSKAALKSGHAPRRAYMEVEDEIDTSVAAVIVLDESWSMSSRLPEATAMLISLTEPLDKIGATMAIGFRDGDRSTEHGYGNDTVGGRSYHRMHGVHIDVFKSFNESFESVKWRLANTQADGGTPMADGVQVGLELLSERREAHRILFVITDGRPNGGHAEVIQRQIRLAKEAGIHVVGVGIGAGTGYVSQVFADSVVESSVASMPNALINKLNDLLDFRGLHRGRRLAETG